MIGRAIQSKMLAFHMQSLTNSVARSPNLSGLVLNFEIFFVGSEMTLNVTKVNVLNRNQNVLHFLNFLYIVNILMPYFEFFLVLKIIY